MTVLEKLYQILEVGSHAIQIAEITSMGTDTHPYMVGSFKVNKLGEELVHQTKVLSSIYIKGKLPDGSHGTLAKFDADTPKEQIAGELLYHIEETGEEVYLEFSTKAYQYE